MTNWAVLETESDGEILRMFRFIDKNDKVWWVPEAPGNRHYEEYLEWLAEGGVPEVIEA